MLEDIVTNLANHIATGQIPKPYRRGSWRPIGHIRPSSPLLDSVRDLFEGYDQLAKDFSNAFIGNAKMICDVAFNVMGSPGNGCHESSIRRIYGVRAILAIRSRVFLEMLYGFTPAGSMPSNPPPQMSRKLSDKVTRKTSLTATTIHKISQIPKIITSSESKSKRKESTISSLSNNSAKTYLTVPSSSGVGNTFRAAFSRLVSGSWAGWGSKNRGDSMKRWQSESIYGKIEQTDNGDLPGLSVCADVAKIDRSKLAQTEVRTNSLLHRKMRHPDRSNAFLLNLLIIPEIKSIRLGLYLINIHTNPSITTRDNAFGIQDYEFSVRDPQNQ